MILSLFFNHPTRFSDTLTNIFFFNKRKLYLVFVNPREIQGEIFGSVDDFLLQYIVFHGSTRILRNTQKTSTQR